METQEPIDFQIPKISNQPIDPRYFQKELIWMLVPKVNASVYPNNAIEKDASLGIRYQEIHQTVVPELLGTTSNDLCLALNTETCFDFEYTPQDQDHLLIQSRYRYEALASFPRAYQRGFYYMNFTFDLGNWTIDKVFKKQAFHSYLSGRLIRT